MKASLLLLLFFAVTQVFANDGIAWESLTKEQQTLLQELQSDWDDLPLSRQQRLANGAERWSSGSS